MSIYFSTSLSLDKVLNWVEFWYNTLFHSVIGMTPFEALYVKPPIAIKTYVQGSSSIEVVDSDLISREKALAQLK